MKHLILFSVLLNVFIFSFSQSKPQKTSTNGEVFTPKGDLRALIIYAGFKGHDGNQETPHWKANEDLPDYVKDGAYLETFYNDTSLFENNPNPENMSISRLFYEMSNKKFRFIADVYPKRININPKNIRGWSKMNLAVIEKMQKKDPNFDWSPYDQRKNRPNYLFDNSATKPDGKPDYVIIVYRYMKSWKIQPVAGMNRWQGSGGGVSVLQGVRNFKFNNKYTITSDGFHMNTVGVKEPEDFRRLFQHELGHELLSCPHHFGTGGTLGQYFRSSIFGWGTAVSAASSTRLVNAWERWMLGWIEIKNDLKDYNDNGTYTINDYATTGEVIRIKIPHTKTQYLWIENHQLKSIFDHNRMAGELENEPEGTSGIADLDPGLYMYIEDLMDEREKIRTYIVSDMKKVNGTKFLNAGGNWDYNVPSNPTKSWKEYWNNTLYAFERKAENPFSGINPFQLYRFDADGNGRIDNQHNFNTSRKTESFPIVKETANDSSYLFYSHFGGINEEAKPYRRSQAFVKGDTLSMSHNPPVINNPRYIQREKRERPIFLNGIKIIVTNYENGIYTLKISFDNNKIENDTRVSGNIILKDIPNTEIDFDVLENKTVTVNKSGTINCLEKLDGSFTHETTFVIDSATVNLREKSSFSVSDSSTVLFKNNSKFMLNSNSTLFLKNESKLLLSAGTEITINENTKIICEDKGTLTIQKGATLNGITLLNDFTHPLEDHCTGKQLLKNLKKLNK